MGHAESYDGKQDAIRTDKTDELPCWREILSGAFVGLHECNQQLEQLFDHLERQK